MLDFGGASFWCATLSAQTLSRDFVEHIWRLSFGNYFKSSEKPRFLQLLLDSISAIILSRILAIKLDYINKYF